MTTYIWDALNVDANRMEESRISAGATQKILGWEKSHAETVASSYDMESHATKCVGRHCELEKKVAQTNLTTINSKKEELEMVGELSKVWSQVVLMCENLARIGKTDVLSSVNKLTRSLTTWKRACDKRLDRLTSYIHYAREITDNIATQYRTVDWDCSNTHTFLGTLKIRNQHRGEFCVSSKLEHSFP